MRMTHKKTMRSLLASAAAIGAAMGAASAQVNEAGEVIVNTFTLNYEVNSTPQAEITNGDPGDPTVGTTFTVDRTVDVEVTSNGNANGTAPGQTDVPLFYTVDNEGNDNFRYLLAALDNPTNDGATGATADNFDTQSPTSAEYNWFVGVAGTPCSGDISLYTNTTAAVTTDIAPGGRLCVAVRRNVPTTATDGQQAGLVLTATATFPSAWANTNANNQAGTPGTTGDPVTSGGGTNTINGDAQNVFLDDDNDGADEDEGFILVSAAALAAAKYVYASATDGTTCTAPTTPVAPGSVANGEFFVPGACVVYVITVANAGSTDADDIELSDFLPEGVSFADATLSGDLTGTLAEPAANCSADAGVPTVCEVSVSAGTVAAGEDGALVIAARLNG